MTNFTFGNDLSLAQLEVTGQAKISATVAQELANIITIDVNNHVHDIGLTLEKRA